MPETQVMDETTRLEVLRAYRILDTPPEEEFEDLAALAAQVCAAPISLVSLVDRDRQWFKAHHGIGFSETPRSLSFCAHAIQKAPELLEVPDARVDPRFAKNELVLGGPRIRFYSGAPLVTPEGAALGTLCVVDTKARRLTAPQRQALRVLGRQVMGQIELRRRKEEMKGFSADAFVAERTGPLRESIEELNAFKERLLRENRRLELLNEAGQSLLTAGIPDEMVEGVYARIADYFQTSGFVEFSVVPGAPELQLESVGGSEKTCYPRGFRLKFGEGIAGSVALQMEPQVFSHVQASTDAQLSLVKGQGVRAYACYPLVVGERLLGTIAFASLQRDEFDAGDQRFFQILASNLALAKDRLRLMRELTGHARNLEQVVSERTAKLQEMMAELRQMSYSMVHEMRAPLRAITSFVELTLQHLQGRLNPQATDFLNRIRTSAARMDLLVTDALNYNKVLQEPLNLEPVDVGHILCDMVSTTAIFQPPNAVVVLRRGFPRVLGNKGLLARCCYHLLHNAVTYVPPGRRPRVEVWAQTSAGKVQLCFSDNGTGIAPEAQRRIFSLFERAESDLGEGTGVGLALTRKTVERMQGRLWVESTLGEGSRFWVELQAAPPAKL